MSRKWKYADVDFGACVESLKVFSRDNPDFRITLELISDRTEKHMPNGAPMSRSTISRYIKNPDRTGDAFVEQKKYALRRAVFDVVSEFKGPSFAKRMFDAM